MMQKKKILVGDDKSVNRYMLRAIFEDDYEIVECKNGMEVIAALKQEGNEFAVILLDLFMPESDGFYVLKQMQEERLETVPVVVITANPDDEVIRKTFSYHIADYIQKPFQENVVKQRVEHVINKYKKQRDVTSQKLAI